jgi:hypothetical protein
MKIRVRFNKSRGQEGRGTIDHAWRVFVGKKEYLAKHVVFAIPCHSDKECCSDDWNMVADGQIQIDRDTSTIIVVAE